MIEENQMKNYTQVYVKNSFDAAKMYCKAFGAEITREFINEDGYYLYAATEKDGTYKRIATLKSNENITYTYKKLKTGKNYYFKIKSYVKAGNAVYTGADSGILCAATKPGKVNGTRTSWLSSAGDAR